MTARGNIEAALAPRNMLADDQRARAETVIKLVGLTPLRSTPTHASSPAA